MHAQIPSQMDRWKYNQSPVRDTSCILIPKHPNKMYSLLRRLSKRNLHFYSSSQMWLTIEPSTSSSKQGQDAMHHEINVNTTVKTDLEPRNRIAAEVGYEMHPSHYSSRGEHHMPRHRATYRHKHNIQLRSRKPPRNPATSMSPVVASKQQSLPPTPNLSFLFR